MRTAKSNRAERSAWWAGRESNPHSRRRLIYSQRSSPPAQPTHAVARRFARASRRSGRGVYRRRRDGSTTHGPDAHNPPSNHHGGPTVPKKVVRVEHDRDERESEPTWTPSPAAKQQATRYRTIAVVLWVVAIAGGAAAVVLALAPPFGSLTVRDGAD